MTNNAFELHSGMSQEFDVPQRPLTIKPATLQEIDTVLSILDEVSDWLMSRGIDQWHPGTFDPIRTGQRIEDGEVYLARIAHVPVATLTLQWDDRLVWGETHSDARYVHRLAVRRAYGGKGVGRTLLKWAEEETVRSGREFLRLDCMKENDALHSYYTAAGFTYVRDVSGKSWSASLFEKRVMERITPHAPITIR
jgi:GNAT superfamily N-acetyltransferase